MNTKDFTLLVIYIWLCFVLTICYSVAHQAKLNERLDKIEKMLEAATNKI